LKSLVRVNGYLESGGYLWCNKLVLAQYHLHKLCLRMHDWNCIRGCIKYKMMYFIFLKSVLQKCQYKINKDNESLPECSR
jgi:hypothetical protein